MKTTQEYIDLLKEHATELQTRFGISSMRLFGSVARGEHRADSDVDVFVDMPPKAYTICAAAQFLEELFGCKVDLIRNRRNLRPSFKQQIEEDGIVIFETT